MENMKQILVYTLLAILPGMAFSEITEEGVGILFGEDHAFSFQAPPGWVLDNESGVAQGLHAVFYQAGRTWKDATVIAYARAAGKDVVIRDIPSLVQFNVDKFRRSGSPNFKARYIKNIQTTEGDRVARIYYFEGDAWGNYEAAGYVMEQKTINFIILSGRSKESFEAALPAFEKLVASYLFLSDHVVINGQPESE
jgi:hypothetical protein